MHDAKRVSLERDVPAILLENDELAVTLLVDKGADLYQLVYKPHGIDVLWKSPWGLRKPGSGMPSAFNSAVTWIEGYEGGWQVLFPNGGAACMYKGVELNFHGEASCVAWHVAELGISEVEAGARLTTRLTRSPFSIEREIAVPASGSTLLLRERVTNDGGEPMEYMWGHHPAFGAPFISGDCRIDTNARTILADDAYDPPHNPMTPAASYAWPFVSNDAGSTDLGLVPGTQTPRAALGYFTDYDETAWCGITNRSLGFGIGLAWERSVFPCAWFWQEMHASPGFPWYQGVYVMAIEPNTSYPGQGLVAVSEKTGTQRSLEPGESHSASIRVVFYESQEGISGIELDGTVRR